MKKPILIAIALAALGTPAQDTNIVAQTLRSDGSTNTWNAADLQDALGLMNRKYWRDMESESGRVAWHGKMLQQYVLTNETGKLVSYKVYADGYTHQTEATPHQTASRDPEAELKAAAQREAALQAFEASHLPPAVAAMLAARRAAAATNTVTVIVSP